MSVHSAGECGSGAQKYAKRIGSGHVAALVAILTLLNGCGASLHKTGPPPRFAFELPRGTSFGNATIVVSRKVEAEHGASVLGRTTGSFGTLACAGARCSETELGRGSTTGSIRSLGSVELEDASHVAGDVTTEGRVRVENSAHVDGTTTSPSSLLRPTQSLAWVSELPSQQFGDVRVEGGQTRSLPPASYGSVRVEAGILELTAGTYSFRSLEIEHGGTLRVLHGGQAVVAYIDDELEQSGAIDDAGDASHLLLAFSGRDKVRFRGPLRATLVAPQAEVALGELRTAEEHQGTAIARSVSLGERTTLRHVLFAHWGLLLQPRPVLECVSAFTDDAFNALFGYDNDLDIPLNVPRGPHNRLEPNGDGVPPELFAPGRSIGVFTTTLPVAGVGYRLGTNLAPAARASLPRCTGAEYQNLPGRVPPGIVDPDRPGPWDPLALERLRTGKP
jgi:hypothetical protein